MPTGPRKEAAVDEVTLPSPRLSPAIRRRRRIYFEFAMEKTEDQRKEPIVSGLLSVPPFFPVAWRGGGESP